MFIAKSSSAMNGFMKKQFCRIRNDTKSHGIQTPKKPLFDVSSEMAMSSTIGR